MRAVVAWEKAVTGIPTINMYFVDWGQMFDSLCGFCDFHVFVLFSMAY